MDNIDKTEDCGYFSTGVVIVDARAHATTQTSLICSSKCSHGSKNFNALVNVNSKLGRWNLHCKELQCVVAYYLVSMVLLKCVDNLIIHYSHYSQIIPPE